MNQNELKTLKIGDKLEIRIGKRVLSNYWFKAIYHDDIVLGTSPNLKFYIRAHHSLVFRSKEK